MCNLVLILKNCPILTVLYKKKRTKYLTFMFISAYINVEFFILFRHKNGATH